jgi:hypothetical protein
MNRTVLGCYGPETPVTVRAFMLYRNWPHSLYFLPSERTRYVIYSDGLTESFKDAAGILDSVTFWLPTDTALDAHNGIETQDWVGREGVTRTQGMKLCP